MSLFNRIFGGGDAPFYPTDELNINGKSLKLSFYAHASIAIGMPIIFGKKTMRQERIMARLES